ncbi:MAG: hypothetical protein WAX89_07250 [Alphaproteobacteria bacterium]
MISMTRLQHMKDTLAALRGSVENPADHKAVVALAKAIAVLEEIAADDSLYPAPETVSPAQPARY